MAAEESPMKGQFHLALAAIVLPFATFFVSGGLAIYNLLRPSHDAAHATWTKRLFALAVIDFLVLLSMGVVAKDGALLTAAGNPGEQGPRIGISMSAEGGAARVIEVRPGSPAERAGIRPGDDIVRVDGEPISTPDELTKKIAETKPGEARTLVLSRGGEEVTVSAVPELMPRERREQRPLFEPLGPREGISKSVPPLFASWLAVALPLGLLLMISRHATADQRPTPRRFWLALVLILGLPSAMMVGSYAALQALLGGRSLGASLVSLSVGSGALLLGALGWRSRFSAEGAFGSEEGNLPFLPAVLQGAGYMMAGLLRVGILLSAATVVLGLPKMDPGRDLREVVHQGMGPMGIALLVLAAVILAPIGEETLFRGILLPYLGRFMKTEGAVWISAILFGVAHLRYGIYLVTIIVYGVVLGWARVATGNVRASIALHMLINGTATLVVLLGR